MHVGWLALLGEGLWVVVFEYLFQINTIYLMKIDA